MHLAELLGGLGKYRVGLITGFQLATVLQTAHLVRMLAYRTIAVVLLSKLFMNAY